MTDRTERPTEERLAELRQQGIVPCSSLCTRSGVAAAVVVVGAFLYRNQLAAGYELWSSAARGAGLNLSQLRDLLALGAEVLAALALAVIFSGFLTGLLQTGFFFSPGLASLRSERISPFKNTDLVGLRGALIVLAAGAGGLLLWGLCFQAALGQLLVMLSYPRGYLVRQFSGLLSAAAVITMFGCAVFGLAAWLLNRQIFIRRHRMSREEILRQHE